MGLMQINAPERGLCRADVRRELIFRPMELNQKLAEEEK